MPAVLLLLLLPVGTVLHGGPRQEQPAGAQDAVETVEFTASVTPASSHPRIVEAAEGQARVAAARRCLESRLVTDATFDAFPEAIRAILLDMAVAYLEERIDLAGRATFTTTRAADGTATATLTVPADLLAEHNLSSAELVEQAIARLDGEGTVIEGMVALELLSEGDPRLAALSRTMLDRLVRRHGSGLRLSIEDSWGNTGEPGWELAWSLWGEQMAAQLQRGLAFATQLPDLPSAGLQGLAIEDLFKVAGRHGRDPLLVALLRERLADAGWTRTSVLFPETAGQASPDAEVLSSDPVERSDAHLAALVGVIRSPRLVRQYVAEGMAVEPIASRSSEAYAEAMAAFGKGGEDGVARTVELLAAQSMQAPLSVDEWNLLASALLNLREPALARAFARVAFIADRSHPYAGINFMRSGMALELDEEVGATFDSVVAEAALDDWGQGRIEECVAWLVAREDPGASDVSMDGTLEADDAASDTDVSEQEPPAQDDEPEA